MTATQRGPRDDENDVTGLLRAWRRGEPNAEERVVPLVYGELRKIAAAYLTLERGGHTLQPTALAHEAYLRLVGQDRMEWQGRAHFFAIAARVTHRILIDHARRHHALKRGRGTPPVSLSEVEDLAIAEPQHLLALDHALARLDEIDPFKASVVEFRFFGGMTGIEIAEVLGCSSATVQRHWRLAKAWLYRELSRA